LDHFPKYHIKILLGDFSAKMGRENIFKSTIRNESLHQDSNDSDVRIAKVFTSTNPIVKCTMTHIETFTRTPDCLQTGRHTPRLITY